MKARKELKEFRTPNSKRFLNKDGTIQVELYKEPIHYKSDNGQYEEIDNTFEETTTGIKNKRNDFIVEFDEKNENCLLNISSKGHKLCMYPKKIKGKQRDKKSTKGTKKRRIDRVKYEGILDNTDIEYELRPKCLKESIVLHEKPKNNIIEFILKTDLELSVNTDNSIYISNGKETLFKLEKPFMIDNKKSYSESIKYEIEKNKNEYEIRMVLDNEWINSKEREYPVIIDPTIMGVEESNSVIDTYIFDGDENITTYNQPCLYVGTDKDNKIYRSLLKFNLPKIPAGYKVVDASVNLSCYPDEFGLAYLDKVPLISIHKITNDWNENTAKWNNMQNSFSNRIEDYYTANRMDSFHQEPGYEYIDQFKLTNLVQQWYNGEPNYGIMLKEYKEEIKEDSRPAFYVSKDYDDTSYLKPLISITYKNFNGIESYMSYTTQEHNFGEASINNYTGNLTVTYNVANTVGGTFPAQLYLVYNTTNVELNDDYGYGLGIKPNYIQTLEKELIDETELLKYLDEDGTVHYFQREILDHTEEGIVYSDKYYDEDGLELSIEHKEDYYEMTDKYNSSYKFLKHIVNNNEIYYLEELKNVDGKIINIQFDNERRITKIIDSTNQEINITYENNKIVFNSPHFETIIDIENNLIKRITSLGVTENIVYNSNNLVEKILMLNENAIKFEYINQISYRVNKVSEISNLGNEGDYLTFYYNLDDTKIVDRNGQVNTYIFNSYGNLVGITSLDENDNLNNAYGKSYVYGSAEEHNQNRLLSDCPLVKYVDNLVEESSFEDNELIRFSNGDINTTNVRSSAYSKSGLNSLEIDIPSAGGCIFKEFVVEKGKTYTFSGYIKGASLVEEVEAHNLDLILSYNDTQSVTHITKLTTDFTRYSVTINYNVDATENLKLTIRNVDERHLTMYLDDIQLEEGEVANYYNLVDNSSFKYGTNGWTTSSDNALETIEVVDLQNNVKALKIHSEPIGNISVEKRFNVKGQAGDTYNLSFWYKNEGIYPSGGEGLMPGCWATIFFGYNDGQDLGTCVPAKYLNIGSDNWQLFSENFQAEFDYDFLEININNFGSANDCYYTNFSLYKDLEAYSYEYDENGNLVSTIELSKEKNYANYDNKNQMTQIADSMGNNLIFEYANNKTNRIVGTFATTGVASTLIYDNDGNIKSSKVSNVNTLGEITNEIKYAIRAKGTNKYFYINSDKTIRLKEFECSYDNFYLIKEENKIKLKHAILNNYYIKKYNNEIILQYGDNNNEFQIISNINHSYSIAVVNNQNNQNDQYEVLTISNNNIILEAYQEGNYHQEFYFEQTENKEYIESNFTYTDDGRFIKKIKDSLENEVIYETNPISGVITSVSNANRDITEYTYNDNLQISRVNQGTQNVSYEYDEYNNISKIKHGNTSHIFEYDEFNNNTILKVNNNILIRKEFEANNGKLKKINFGNNQSIQYEYDKLYREKRIIKEDDSYTHYYDNLGRTVKTTSNKDTYNYEYDFAQRLSKYKYNDFSTEYDYEKNNHISKKIHELGLDIYKYEYKYNSDSQLTKLNVNNDSFNYSYDVLGRIKEKNINNEYKIKYDYITKGKKTSTLINKVDDNGTIYTYEYDKTENITDIYINGLKTNKYYYDGNSQLIKEEDFTKNTVIEYTYDNCGNLNLRKIYDKESKTVLKEDIYIYDNNNWNDLLTSYNNSEIMYDEIGNTLQIGSKTFVWKNGRELAEYHDEINNMTFEYDITGIRISKKVNNFETKYYYENEQLIFENQNGNMLYYMYDLNGELLGFTYGNNKYYYRKNLFNDIIGIFDSNYNEIVSYEYDSWGNITKLDDNSNLNLGTMNPFRYRSYYYDKEMDLYYLKTRYYNPKTQRFISADNRIGIPEKTLSYNKFLYAFNNPINLIDDEGDWPKLPKLKKIAENITKVVIGTAVIAATAGLAMTVGGAAGVIAGAACVGAVIGAGIGTVVGGVHAAKKGENVVDGMVNGFAIGSVVGAGTGAAISAIGIKTGAVKIIGSAQKCASTQLHRFASNIHAGFKSLLLPFVDKIYLNKSMSQAGLAGGAKRPDVITFFRNGKVLLVEYVSRSQKKELLEEAVEKLAGLNNNCFSNVYSWTKTLSKFFWK